MTEVYEVDPARLGDAERALGAAFDALSVGQLVVFPTETVYGIACRPDNEDATARLFEAKRRPTGLNLPVLAGSIQAAWQVAEPNRAARRLAEACWPGPLTMVLPRANRSRRWNLGEAHETVAVRVPNHPLCLAVLGRSGPLAATSANVSGRPPVSRSGELIAAFGEAVAVYLVLDPHAAQPAGVASTVVDLTREPPRVLRTGPTGRESILRIIAGGGQPTGSGESDPAPPSQSVH